ncbi:hypothetical protein ACFLXV_00160 [Chloroflexota bacterium]
MRKLAISVILLLTAALILSAAGCGTGDSGTTPTPIRTPAAKLSPTLTPPPTPTSTPEAAYITHNDALNGFSIAYPEDWEVNSFTTTLFELRAPEQCNEQGVTFYIQKMGAPTVTDIETFFGPILDDTFLSPEIIFIYGEKVTVSGWAAIKWVTVITNANELPLKEMSVYVLETGAAWILTFTAAFNCWNQYEDAFEHMLSSFHLL